MTDESSCTGCSRRTVLAVGGAVGAATVLAACSGGSAGSPAAPVGGDAGNPVITDLATLRTKGAVTFRSASGGAIAIDLGDRVVAWTSTCTHQGCTVGWSAADKLIECPCHGSRYDPTTGRPVRGPAVAGLHSVPVTVDQASGQLTRG
jgi:cytochrome b6-f complex iron-sulfur subunit